MNTDLQKLENNLKQKNVPLQHYCDFLQFENSPFSKLNHYLNQQNIDLKEYEAFLSQAKAQLDCQKNSNSHKTDALPTIKKIGFKLLKDSKLSLMELNTRLSAIPVEKLTKQKLLQTLLLHDQIDSDYCLFLFQDNWEIEEKTPFQMEIQDQIAVFSLKKSEQAQHFGKYQILEELGRGAMGIVYKAYHSGLNQVVALKVLAPKRDSANTALQRFEREIQTMAKLEHPGIVQILDTGQEEDRFYFAMEYVEGITLAEYLAQNQYKPVIREFLLIVIQLLEALSYAHAKGIIHRDIKPDNIFINQQNQPKIGDFGLAKSLYDFQKLTQTGTILGTASYMSPEQAKGESSQLDLRSDLYAIGTCLYQGITGKLPFTAPNMQILLYKIMKLDPLAPSQKNSAIHRDLETITLKSLEKQRANRYQSAKAFAHDLERFLKGYPITAKAASGTEKISKWAKRNRRIIFTFSTIFVFFISLVFFSLWIKYHEKRKEFDLVYQQASQEIKKVKNFQKQKIKNSGEQANHLFKALTILNVALSMQQNEKKAEQTKWEVGNQLLTFAYQKQEYVLAQYLIHQLNQLETVEPKKREKLLQQLAIKKVLSYQNHRKRFNWWKNHLSTTLCKKTKQDDAIFEISKMQEKEILTELLNILQEGTIYFTESKNKNRFKSQYYQTMALALGRLGNTKAVAPLLNALDQIRKKYKNRIIPLAQIDFMVSLSYALLYIKPKNVTKEFGKIRSQIGTNHLFGKRTRKIYYKLHSLSPELEDEEKNLSTKSALMKRAKTEYYKKNYTKSIEVFTKVLQQFGPDDEVYSARATLKRKQENFTGALQDYTEAIRHAPFDNSYYRDRANIKRKLEDLKGALLDINKAIQLNPRIGKYYADRALIKKEQKDYLAAMKDFDEALKLDPQRKSAYVYRARLKIKLKDNSGAMKDFNQALQQDPKDEEIYRQRGYLKELKKDYQGALRDYDQAILLKPNSAKNYFYRGFVKVKIENLNEAIQDFEESIRLDPKLENTYHDLGYCYYKIKKIDKAIETLQKSLELKQKASVRELFLKILLERILKKQKKKQWVQVQKDIALFRKYASKKNPSLLKLQEIENKLKNKKIK